MRYLRYLASSVAVLTMSSQAIRALGAGIGALMGSLVPKWHPVGRERCSMRILLRCLYVMGSSGVVVCQGTAQEVEHLGPHARVRVSTPRTEPQVLTLIDLRGDTLVLQTEKDADTVRLIRATVTRLEVSQGRRSHVGQGALIGAIAAGATGFLLGRGLDHTDVCTSGCEWAVAAPFAAGGAVLGALAGALTHTERWQDVSADRIRLSVVPWSHGVGLTMSAPF